MPELPEVEVTRRSLVPCILNATVNRVVLGKPLRWPLGVSPDALVGLEIKSVERRGKYLLFELVAGGAGCGVVGGGYLLVHLGMSGSLLFDEGVLTIGPHDHFVLWTTAGMLRLRDHRRFGAVVFVEHLLQPLAVKLLGHLGSEPLSDDFDPVAFSRAMQGSKVSVKQLLLGGRIVVGVGNIYASEVLFQSGIHPCRPGQDLEDAALHRLHAAIRQVLTNAVARGGTTLRDFSSADGQAGHFQSDVKVYGREGLPCVVCGHSVHRLTQGQRSTYFCAVCQPA
jgi:formamidopyrimidine-DNA glycosylase